MIKASTSRADETRRELFALLLASLACVTVLTLNLVDARQLAAGGVAPSQVLTIATLAGILIGAAAIAFVLTQRARRSADAARAQAADMRRELIMTEAVFKAEPQILIFWEQGQGLKVVTHTLHTVAGIPASQPQLLKFGWWLDDRSARDLKVALDALFQDGRSFNLFVKTKQGGHVEADGRAAGGRAILRFRDVAGYKHDLVQVIEQQRMLARDLTLYRSLLDSLPMPVWLRDASGDLAWVNAAYARAVEAANDKEVIDQQIELLEGRQRTALASVLRAGQIERQRLHLVVGGERKAHDVILAPTEDSIAAVAIDVAELETAQGELNKQTSAYDRTLDRVSTGVAMFNAAQQLTFYNEAYCKLWELDPDWLDQAPTDGQILDRLRELARLPFRSDYRAWKQELMACYKTRREIEDLWHLPDGRMVQVIGEQRDDGGMTYLYEDLSEQFALESRYKTLIQVQSETLDSLREGVAVFSSDARLRLFNPAFAQIWRLPRSALAQRPRIDELVEQLGRLHDDGQVWSEIIDAITALSGEYKSRSGTMERADGNHIDYAAIPLPDGGTLLTFSDVTATRRYQRALVERNEALIAADRLKSNFISHVSYELRTPLTDIIGFSELLESPRTGELNEKQREYLGAVGASSRTLRSVIDNILDLASIDAGALDLRIENVEARNVIDTAIEGVRDRAARARITIDIGLAEDLTTFEADEQRIRQVIYNLLSNAIGFSKAGDTVFVSGWRETDQVVFEVADQGIGIPAEDQEQIFDRFVSRSQGSKHRGAGLGLAIVKSLVELHGGTISLTSVRDQGTRIIVRLPRQAVRNDIEDEQESSSRTLTA